MGIEETYLEITNATYEKLTTNIILSKEKLKSFSLTQNKMGMCAFTSHIQHSTRNPTHRIQKKQIIRSIQLGKDEVKLSLIGNDIMLYIENLN